MSISSPVSDCLYYLQAAVKLDGYQMKGSMTGGMAQRSRRMVGSETIDVYRRHGVVSLETLEAYHSRDEEINSKSTLSTQSGFRGEREGMCQVTRAVGATCSRNLPASPDIGIYLTRVA
jgi:hypothetical protein